MSVPASLAQLAGEWRGKNSLWLSTKEPPRISETTMSISLAVKDEVLSVRQTWADGGQAQEGLLVVQHNAKSNVATGAWTDTWHLADTFMQCRGSVDASGRLSVEGTYAALPGPDWGWRIVLEPRIPAGLRLLMYNVSPEGVSDLAVDAVYLRSSSRPRRAGLHAKSKESHGSTDVRSRTAARSG